MCDRKETNCVFRCVASSHHTSADRCCVITHSGSDDVQHLLFISEPVKLEMFCTHLIKDGCFHLCETLNSTIFLYVLYVGRSASAPGSETQVAND